MKRIPAVIVAVILALCACGPAGAEREIPQCLRFKQKMTVTKLSRNRVRYITLPTTALQEVDREIAETTDRLYAEAEPHLASKGVSSRQPDWIDVGTYITRTGDRWMSFLTISRVTRGTEQVYADFDTRVYNMETGDRVPISRVIDAEKGGWEFLASEVRKQISAHFPRMEADEQALDSLCARDALENAAFTLSPGHMTLRYHARDVYPEAPEGFLRADIYYPDLKPYMTEEAVRETDCTGYMLAALTYDDGPAGKTSDAVMNQLRIYGAEATFFAVGERMHEFPRVLHREYDAGFSVQSHNWVHDIYAVPTREQLAEWIRLTDEELSSIIGVGPGLMRSPGGNEVNYINAGVTLPMIHWSEVSGDSVVSRKQDVYGVARHVGNSRNGDIVLCHDFNGKAGEYARNYLPMLEKRDFLLVTVEDLCVLRGITLRPADVLMDGYPAAE